jgi:ribulose-5-phosphate 4-epimerase/fuculose-1-phosphate aldolase
LSFYKEREIAEDLAQACRVLGAYDMTHAALGHVSYRLEGTDTMLIKGKGVNEVGLRYTRPRDIVKVDFDANMVDGPDDLQPPSESFLHSWVYKMRPEVKSVVHVHPEYSVLISITGKEIYPIYGPYRPGSNLARDGVPVYPDSRTIGTAEQGEEFAKCMGNKDVALMVGHGIASAGDCIERSTMNALALETLCRTMFKAYLIGTPNRLPDGALGTVGSQPLQQGRRPRGNPGGVEGMMAGWRYYVSRAEEMLGHRIEEEDR